MAFVAFAVLVELADQTVAEFAVPAEMFVQVAAAFVAASAELVVQTAAAFVAAGEAADQVSVFANAAQVGGALAVVEAV